MQVDPKERVPRRGRHPDSTSGPVYFVVVLAFAVLGAAIFAYMQHKIALELLIAVLSLFATVALALWHTRVHRHED